MNFKKITALVLALLFSVNETASNVFAMNQPSTPLFASSDLEQTLISFQENNPEISLLDGKDKAKTDEEKQEIDSKDVIDTENQPEVKNNPDKEKQEVKTKDKTDTENQEVKAKDKTDTENQEVKAKDKTDTENQTELKVICRKILNCEDYEKFSGTQYFEKKAALAEALKLLADKEKAAFNKGLFSTEELNEQEKAYRTRASKDYKEYMDIIDEFLNTDFYTVSNEKDNFQSKFGNINDKISETIKSVGKTAAELNNYKNKINTNQIDRDKLVINVRNYFDGFLGVNKIKTSLDNYNNYMDELIEQTKSLKENKDNIYETLRTKYPKNEKKIYNDIASIIEIQSKKYDSQAEETLERIDRFKQTISVIINKDVSPLIERTSTFINKNPMISHSYGCTEKNIKLEETNADLKRQISILEKQNSVLKETNATLKGILEQSQKATNLKDGNGSKENPDITPSESIPSFKSRSPISNGINQPNVENKNLIGKEISEIFPDQGFAKFVYNYYTYKNKNKPFDPNYKLNILDVHEIETTYWLSFDEYKDEIKSLAGIEYFIGLNFLTCQKRVLYDINLSKNKYLETLNLSESTIQNGSLDLSKNTNLETLNLLNSKIQNGSLDLSENTNLETLDLSNSEIQNGSLVLSKNTNLETLNLSNSKIQNVSLDLSESLKLKQLNCHNCGIKEIILPKTNATAETVEIDLSSNKLSGTLDLSAFKKLKMVNLASNDFTGLTIANENIITELNIYQNQNFRDFNFNILSNLITLNCSETSQKDLLITNLKQLEDLNCSNNIHLKNIDISNCTKLKELNCRSCSIKKLNLSSLTSLQSVNCSYNNIEELCIKSNELKKLLCVKNPLNTIKIPNKVIAAGLDLDHRYTGKRENGKYKGANIISIGTK